MDSAQIQGSAPTSHSESVAPGATIHEEIHNPFPGLQETPLHAV